MPGVRVDGNDPLAVNSYSTKRCDGPIAGGGPTSSVS